MAGSDVCVVAPAQGLNAQGYEIISTGGTATAIQNMGVPVKKVEDVTGFPEMLDGRLSRGWAAVPVCACVCVWLLCCRELGSSTAP